MRNLLISCALVSGLVACGGKDGGPADTASPAGDDGTGGDDGGSDGDPLDTGAGSDDTGADGAGGDSDSGGAGGDTDTDDPPYIYDAEDVELPEFDPEAAAAAMEEVLAGARQLNAVPVLEAYVEATAGADPGCPAWTYFGDTPYWYDSCTTNDGTQFEGYATTYEYSGYHDGSVTWDGYQLSGLATVTTPEGYVFEAAGGAYVLWGVTDDGADAFYTVVQDGFAYDGPAAQGTWLGDGVSPEIVSYGLRYPSVDGRAVYVSGRVLVDDGPVEAVVFEELFMYSAELGSPCPSEPAGMVSVLDGEGAWFDILFDGGQWGEAVDADACDGCGGAWYQGSYLGEVCADFGVLLDWENNPWE